MSQKPDDFSKKGEIRVVPNKLPATSLVDALCRERNFRPYIDQSCGKGTVGSELALLAMRLERDRAKLFEALYIAAGELNAGGADKLADKHIALLSDIAKAP